MRRAALYSAALHVAVITVAYFGVPALFSRPPVEDQPLSVDLVTIEDVPRKAPPEPPKPAPPPPVAKPAPPPPPPPPPPAAEPEPPPPVATPAPEPEPPPPPKVMPKPKPPPKPVAKPQPEPPPKIARVAPKPKVKPKRKPPEPDQMQALLKNLAKRKAEMERARKPEPEARPAPRAAPPPQLAARSSIDRQATERRLTALVRQQLAPCWNIPAGAKDAQDMRVGVEIRLNADGSLRGAPQVLDTARMRSDRSFRAVAESAVRALLNPRCSPLKLPYDQYDIWRNITFNFDPSEALGP